MATSNSNSNSNIHQHQQQHLLSWGRQVPAVHDFHSLDSPPSKNQQHQSRMMMRNHHEETIGEDSLFTHSTPQGKDLDASLASTSTPKMNNTFEQRLVPYENDNSPSSNVMGLEDEQTLNDDSVYTDGEEDLAEDEPAANNSYAQYRSGLLGRLSSPLPPNHSLISASTSSSSHIPMVSSIVVKPTYQPSSLLSSFSTPSTVSPQSDRTNNSPRSPSDAMNRMVPYNPHASSPSSMAVRSPPTSLFQADTNLADTKMNPALARKQAALRMAGQSSNTPLPSRPEVFVDDDDASTIDSRPSVDSLGQKLQHFSRRIAKYQAFQDNENASLTFTDVEDGSSMASSIPPPATTRLAQFLMSQSFVAPVDPENDTLEASERRFVATRGEEEAFIDDSSFWTGGESSNAMQLDTGTGGIFYGEPPQHVHRTSAATHERNNCPVDATCFLPGMCLRNDKTHDSNKKSRSHRQQKLRTLACVLVFVTVLCGIVLLVMVLAGKIDAGLFQGPSNDDSSNELEEPVYDVVGRDSVPTAPQQAPAPPTGSTPAPQPSVQGTSQTTNGGDVSTPVPSNTPSAAPLPVESMSPSQSFSSSPSQTQDASSSPSLAQPETPAGPTSQPVDATSAPSGEPTVFPSAKPSLAPSAIPSLAPSALMESVQGKSDQVSLLLEPLADDLGEDYMALVRQEGSLQNQALLSIASLDDFASLSDQDLLQLYSMLVLQGSLGDVTQRRNLNEVSSNVCTWVGVTCNPHNQPIQLMWSQKQLSGAIPAEIAVLVKLEEIYMENNAITGTIPESIGELVELRKLKLNGNSISGPLPSSLVNCTQLEDLDLSDNDFSSELPEVIGFLANLKYLSLDDNSFYGNIPSSYSFLHNLISLSMAENSLSGGIGYISHLQNLESLVLHSNAFSGMIHNFSTLSKVRKMDLSANQFSNRIPTTLSHCGELEELLLYSNNLRGRPPDELESLSKLKLIRLDQNNFAQEPKKKYCDMITEQNVDFWSDCSNDYDCKCCTVCCDQNGSCSDN